ncbi:MAG: tRNA (guanosine(37)-N1)-methyltransferase TrmD [Candidatus Doudnabacteria bacterium]|nr:tRNA (guanosine(37)-N1)-methyltransferase TrmD [Candidatus Doudnabacteria bacterium]
MKKKLSIRIITLFPKFIENFMDSFGIVKRAIKLKLLEIKPVDLRKFGFGQRQTVDGRPYGGGAGMVLRADILLKAILKAKSHKLKVSRIILLTPQGKKFNQATAKRLSKYHNLVLVCGRYEGFDERIRKFVDEEISIGDYVLMGGELPALVISEAVMRLRPGVLGKDESADKESFSEDLLEYPQYTKPEILKVKGQRSKVKSIRVPKVLLTGHHRNIEEWRKKEAGKRTKKRRPDLFD